MTYELKLEDAREEGERKGRAEGRAEGERKGRAEEQLASIRNLMETLQLTAWQAMDALKIPAENQERWIGQL